MSCVSGMIRIHGRQATFCHTHKYESSAGFTGRERAVGGLK